MLGITILLRSKNLWLIKQFFVMGSGFYILYVKTWKKFVCDVLQRRKKKNLGAHFDSTVQKMRPMKSAITWEGATNKSRRSAHSTVQMRPIKSAITWEGAETYLHAYQYAPFNNKIVYYTVRHQLYAFKHFMTG